MNSYIFLNLSQGKFALIDARDFKLVGHFKWNAEKRGRRFYARRTVGKQKIYLHVAIMGKKGIDHRDGNSLDCRRKNLRRATQKQNTQGYQRKRIGSSSKYRGVSWLSKNSAWVAQIYCGEKFYLGSFQEEKTAARAYDKKAKELGFAREALNFP